MNVEQGWQDIASAPKSRGAYFVWCAERQNTYGVVWRDEEAWGEPGWFHFSPGNYRLQERPTHWHPMLAPPEPGK